MGEAVAMMLIDGRNRRAACEIAGVDPTTRLLDGEHDPKAFVISANIHRRHMTKGQQAMAVAMIYPEAEKGGRGKKSVKITEFKFDASYLSHARTVLRHEPDLASLVINGSEKLEADYTTAKSRRDASSLQEPLLAELTAPAFPSRASAVPRRT